MPVKNDAITVSELNRYIKELFFADGNLRRVMVKGEVSNFTDHKKTGHFYFTLKDSSCAVKAVMFRQNAEQVRFTVENGMNVVVTGNVSVFERDGVYQIYCEALEPDGIGALYLAFEQLKEKLYRQGLFDEGHKVSLPPLPRRIGVVTSPTGAALQDIRNVLSRRYPLGVLVVIPALVQGESAAPSIVSGIAAARAAGDIDVLIVGRGGGSIEDLWCFNDERVARAIYDCDIPVISAVGHEIDFTISDFVADLRAPTPSAAAELCAPDRETLLNRIASCAAGLDFGVTSSFKIGYDGLRAAHSRFAAASPAARLGRAAEELPAKASRRQLAIERIWSAKAARLSGAAASLEALSPLKVLTRGYSITYCGDKVVSSVRGLLPGMKVETLLSDGRAVSEIISAVPARNLKRSKAGI